MTTNDLLGWLTRSARLAKGLAGGASSYASRVFQPDPRPVCPECLRRVDVTDEIFMHRGLSFHGACIGYKRPKAPTDGHDQAGRTKKA